MQDTRWHCTKAWSLHPGMVLAPMQAQVLAIRTHSLPPRSWTNTINTHESNRKWSCRAEICGRVVAAKWKLIGLSRFPGQGGEVALWRGARGPKLRCGNVAMWQAKCQAVRNEADAWKRRESQELRLPGPCNQARTWPESYGWMNSFASQPATISNVWYPCILTPRCHAPRSPPYPSPAGQ